MSVLEPPMATPNALKRTYADAELDEAPRQALLTVGSCLQEQTTSPLSDLHSHITTPRFPVYPDSFDTKSTFVNPSLAAPGGHMVSPGPSSSGLSSLNSSPIKFPDTTTPLANPPKRPKTSPMTKEAMQRDKEAKHRIIEEKRAERAERDRLRAEEKARKEEIRQVKLFEKEEKRKAREEENKVREEEKRLKEEEKAKKERSQLKLNAFFAKPSIAQDTSEESPIQEATSPWGSRRNSIASAQSGTISSRRSMSAAPQNTLDDYERQFPSFFLKSHTVLASSNRFSRDKDSLSYACSRLDAYLNPGDMAAQKEIPPQPQSGNLADLLQMAPEKRSRRVKSQETVKDLVTKIHGTSHNPIDLTASKSTQTPFDQLRTLPIKSLKFYEDVRPPYIGTRTQFPSGLTAARLGRKPCRRENSSLDYDYDSEAEWEPLGEGEDLDSEGEDDVEEEDEGDDMKDFVVDEGPADVKNQPFIEAKEQTSTGVCWENSIGRSKTAIGEDDPSIDMAQYKLEMIADCPMLPIDPHSTAYWISATTKRQSANTSSLGMNPPRIPLNAINHTNLNLPNPLHAKDTKGQTLSGVGLAPKAPKPVTAKKFIAPEFLEDFKKAVAGSDFNKALMVETLKKQFSTQSKAAIQDTLNAVAQRIGLKEADKRWAIRPEHVLCKVQGCRGTGVAACEHLATMT